MSKGQQRMDKSRSKKRHSRDYRIAQHLFGLKRNTARESPEQRQELALILRLSGEQKLMLLARDALDPLYKDTSFARLIERSGVSLHEVSEAYRKVKRAEGIIRAANHLPDIMEQVAVDAQSFDEPCSTCGASGKVEDQPCQQCKGEGIIHVLGNIDRIKLMFETFELTGKGRAPLVNVDLRKMDQAESLESLSQSLGPILEGSNES